MKAAFEILIKSGRIKCLDGKHEKKKGEQIRNLERAYSLDGNT